MATSDHSPLDVFISGQLVGSLERPGPGRIRFTYSEAAANSYLGASLLSASLPVRLERYTNEDSKPFFEGLLPEGALRERVARQLRLAYDDVHGMLEQIGVECAGAVVVVPAGDAPPDPSAAEYDWLSEADLVARIEGLDVSPLGITPGRVRLSLGGVQEKLVLARNAAGYLGTPLDGAPSTHILKPDLGRFDGIAANEAFCLRVAACVGLPVVRSEILSVGGYPCLLVDRFDRIAEDSRIERIHQEDFCQALGILPSAKYEADGGPSVAAIVEATRHLSTTAASAVVVLVRSVIFNYLIGNSDAHGKNYALLYEPLTRARLAPLYDLVSTAPYAVEQRLAMSIGGQDDPARVTAEDWQRLAVDARIAGRQLAAELAAMSDSVRHCLASVRDEAHAEGWFHPVIDAIVAVAEGRRRAIES